MENLQHELNILQNKCIGLYKSPYTHDLKMVIEETEYTFKTVVIATLGGLIETTYSFANLGSGIYKRFPNNYTLYTFKQNVLTFNDFCKSFN